MRILFLTNLLPYPLDNGGKIKTYTTLKSLADDGHKIDLLCFKETNLSMDDEECELLKLCNSIEQVFLPLTTADNKKYMIGIAAKSLFSRLPFSIYKYQSKEMIEKLKSKNDRYDVIYFDHLPMCVYLKTVQQLWPSAKTILDEHNCEATITNRKEKETKNTAKKIFLKLETIKLERFESTSIKNVKRTAVLSNADYNCLKDLVGGDFEHSIIPIGVPDRGIKKEISNDKLNILFVGTLTWEPNNAGLIWFLKKVIPLLENAKISYHLYIVGKNPSQDVKELSQHHKEKITVTGYVESVDEYYDKCDCTVVPLFIGSGQRVKLIEAYSKGMPAISTTIGAEGLEYKDGESIIIADDEFAFVKAIISMQDIALRKALKRDSRQLYENYYSPQAVSKMISTIIK